MALGVKSYPRGVTTNSDGGIESYESYYPIFEAMQEVDMVLNLHGEVPSDPNAASINFDCLTTRLNYLIEHSCSQRRAHFLAPSLQIACCLPEVTYRP